MAAAVREFVGVTDLHDFYRLLASSRFEVTNGVIVRLFAPSGKRLCRLLINSRRERIFARTTTNHF
jgi:hypothetical protein